jgi:uncharacterized protein (DUF2147 family)
MIKKIVVISTLALAFSAFASLAAAADTTSPVGLWKTIDDKTGKPKSLVRIVDVNGELRGSVEKLFREPGEDLNPKCDKCTEDKKDKPVIGMTILTGMRADGDHYEGGLILDPANGKTYKTKMELDDKGKKLKVRGYIGVPMLGRTQVWLREE